MYNEVQKRYRSLRRPMIPPGEHHVASSSDIQQKGAPPLMTDKDIEILKDLSETHNITKTAQRLFTTQSALTKRIQSIEQELGCQLFIRSKKGVILTPISEAILPYVRTIQQNLSQIRSLAANPEGELSGTLQVGVAANYARFQLADVLEAFIDQYPKVDIRLSTKRSPDLYQALLAGEINLAVIRGEFPWAEGDIVLSEEPVCLVTRDEMDEEALAALPFIDRTSDISFDVGISRWMNEHKIRRQSGLQINDVDTIMQLIRRGIGWTVLPEICLQNFEGVIKPLRFSSGEAFTRRTHLLYRPDYFRLPQVQAFVETVMNCTHH